MQHKNSTTRIKMVCPNKKFT